MTSLSATHDALKRHAANIHCNTYGDEDTITRYLTSSHRHFVDVATAAKFNVTLCEELVVGWLPPGCPRLQGTLPT